MWGYEGERIICLTLWTAGSALGAAESALMGTKINCFWFTTTYQQWSDIIKNLKFFLLQNENNLNNVSLIMKKKKACLVWKKFISSSHSSSKYTISVEFSLTSKMKTKKTNTKNYNRWCSKWGLQYQHAWDMLGGVDIAIDKLEFDRLNSEGCWAH